MKKNYFFKLSLLMIPAMAFLFMASSGGRDDGRSGSPGDGGATCTACHAGSSDFGLTPSITTDIPNTGYLLNTAYTVNVSSSSSSSKLGFQLAAENDSDTKIGAFTAGSGSRVTGDRITHSTPSTTGNWSFTWTSPATDQGKVTFYSAVNATNGNGSTSGDQVVTTSTSAVSLSIAEAKRLDFEMYPNPAVSDLTIQLPAGTTEATVEFYDNIGRLALTKKVSNSENQINVTSLSSGLYIIKVLAEDKIGTQKFIKE